MTTRDVLDEIIAERARQIDRHDHAAERDDRHPLAAWGWLLGRRASELACPYEDALPDPRRVLVEIAAIAVAAIESIDRKTADGFGPWSSVGTITAPDGTVALVSFVGEIIPEAVAPEELR